ncbi:MAG TPA: glycine zipper 2TM domain-containing protein [Steroidobacteraceae bacterium]|nr:glycine zipper 2TM domain-containing protein [Steroidobacteraceae bacterium]
MFSRFRTAGIVLGTMLSSFAIATSAIAGEKPKYNGRHARVGPAYEYARVVDVQPITRQVRVQTPQRECYIEEYEEPRRASASVAGNVILGGLIGGVLGSQIGSGDGRKAATAAGALIGSTIGHQAAQRRRAEPPQVRTVERCDTRYVSNYEERIEAYDVAYEYGGQRYHTRMPYDPGERIRVRVDVSPVHDGGPVYGDDDDYYED